MFERRMKNQIPSPMRAIPATPPTTPPTIAPTSVLLELDVDVGTTTVVVVDAELVVVELVVEVVLEEVGLRNMVPVPFATAQSQRV